MRENIFILMSELKNWENYSSVSEGDNYQKMAHLDVSDNVSVYNEKEIEYLDRYLPIIKNAFDETELYEIIMDCNFNDEKISEIINERLKYMNAKGDQYGWKVIGKQKPKNNENIENVKKGNNNKQGLKKNKGTKNRQKDTTNEEQNFVNEFNDGEEQGYYQYDNSNYNRGQNYRNYRQNDVNTYDENNNYNYTNESRNYYNYNNRKDYYGNDDNYNYYNQYNNNYNNSNYNNPASYKYTRGNNYYNPRYNNNYNNYGYNNYNNKNSYYYNNDNNNYSSRYVPRYKLKRRNQQYKQVDYVDVTDQNYNTAIENITQEIQLNNNDTNLKEEENHLINTDNLDENTVVDKLTHDNTNEERQTSLIQNNPTTTIITNTLFEDKENERTTQTIPLFEEKIDKKLEELKNDETDVDLKHYFALLRTGATVNNESTISLLNKLKTDVLNNQYYNNNLDLQKKYENVNNSANNTNLNQRTKQQNLNNNLHLNSQFLEINNSKSSSKIQSLDHSRIDNNGQINKLSFTINSSAEKEPETSKKNNNFIMESNSVSISSNKPSQTKPENPINKDLSQNDYLREQYHNFTSNKFNKANPNIGGFPGMYANTPYFFNQEAMNKNPNFDDTQQMMNNQFFPQSPFYPMPYNYYAFPYDRNMFNMQANAMDPAFMNMYFQFQQQPNFYKNMQYDPSMNHYQYTNNVNYKK